MKINRAFTFLYMPENNGASRQVRVPRAVVIVGLGSVLALGTVAVLYGVGLHTGNSWWPGGSRFQRENDDLRGAVTVLENQVDDLHGEISRGHDLQNELASALDVPGIDDDTFAAGIGGRHSLELGNLKDTDFPDDHSAVGLADELDLMLRQAKIQKQGYLALLDTLSARGSMRAHLPSIRPIDSGWLSSRFGFRRDPFTGKETFHRGLDFSVPRGTEVRCTGDGVVAAVQNQRGFGRVVKIDHGNGVRTIYAHLSEPLVKTGQQVRRGAIIARSGSTGRSTGPHLHYEIQLAGHPVNPLTYILESYATRR